MSNQHRMSGSNNEITYEEAVEFLPAYALGALESDEMLAVEQQIEAHPTLQQRLEKLTETVAALAHTAPPVAAPASLKSSILSRAQNSMRNQADQTAAIVANGSEPAPAVPARPRVQTLSLPPISSPRQDSAGANHRANPQRGGAQQENAPWWAWIVQPRTWQLASAALMLVLALVTVTAVQLRNLAVDLQAQLDDAQQRLAELESTNDDLIAQRENAQSELTVLRNQLSDQDFRLTLLNNQLDLLANPERVITLALNDTAGGEDVRGSFYAQGEGGVLLLHGLEALPSDQTYELWLIPDGGDAVPAGLFDAASASGDSELTVWTNRLPLAPDQYSTVGISIEPAGGSESPTGPVILLGSQA